MDEMAAGIFEDDHMIDREKLANAVNKRLASPVEWKQVHEYDGAKELVDIPRDRSQPRWSNWNSSRMACKPAALGLLHLGCESDEKHRISPACGDGGGMSLPRSAP